MDGIIASVFLVVLLIPNYYLVSSATGSIANTKLRSLIIALANFVLVMLFFICLPLIGGYSYDSFQDVLSVIFSEDTAALPIITIVGFSIAKIYFATDTYSIENVNRLKRKIPIYQQETSALEKQIHGRKRVAHLLMLLNNCCEDMTGLSQNSEIVAITQIEINIQKSMEA